MRSSSENKRLSILLTMAAVTAMASQTPALAETYTGTTTLSFSANPATLSGDGTPDVTITTTTTASGGAPALIDAGKVMIEYATDGIGNPVPAASAVTWVAVNDPGQNPTGGATTLDVDLDGLGFFPGMVVGFRAHYVTGGGKDKVGTHFSVPVDLTIAQECVWIGETAWAAGTPYVAQGNWATYTEYGEDRTVALYAGQTMDAGTVHFSAPVGGVVTITITLNAGWRFKDVAENVKIQDYATAPTGNPNPGSFAAKGDATGSPFSIEVPANNYYGVHVDVEWQYCE